jgi:hypothetical protein
MKAELIEGPGAAWEECERLLDEAGAPLGLFHRACWARARSRGGTRYCLVALRSSRADCRAAFAVESRPTRALRGHRVLSLVRLGIGEGGLDDESLALGLREVVRYARADKSVLRVTADSFSVESDWLLRTGDALRQNGFRQTAPQRSYARTLLLDLEPTEDELMAGLHRSARRNIRDAAKFPVTLEGAESESLAERLQELDDETRARTGGKPRAMDWASMIRMTTENPGLSRISLLRRTDRNGPDAVLAYAWCCKQGEIAQYSESGSTRADDLKVSTSYVLLWDLICWARRNGARHFDFGGITGGAEDTADPLGGISDFKRRFTPFEFDVGQEWSFEPHPARAAAARVISRGAGLLRNTARRIATFKS